jgi:hypothetical protein
MGCHVDTGIAKHSEQKVTAIDLSAWPVGDSTLHTIDGYNTASPKAHPGGETVHTKYSYYTHIHIGLAEDIQHFSTSGTSCAAESKLSFTGGYTVKYCGNLTAIRQAQVAQWIIDNIRDPACDENEVCFP